MEDKSYVKYLLKQGVTGGRGYEIEMKVCKGDSPEELEKLGERVIKSTENVINKTLQ